MAEEYVGRKFKTQFLDSQKNSVECDESNEMLDFSKKLTQLGFLKGIPGNFSVRTQRGFIITAGGVDKEKLAREDLVEVLDYSKEKDIVSISGIKEPSSEARMHYMIYRKYSEVNAILHVHDSLVLENEDKAREQGVVFTKKEVPYGTIELAEQVIEALKKSRYIVMLNHGSVAVGGSLREAQDLAVSVHRRLEA